jgi:hypothetical protein
VLDPRFDTDEHAVDSVVLAALPFQLSLLGLTTTMITTTLTLTTKRLTMYTKNPSQIERVERAAIV